MKRYEGYLLCADFDGTFALPQARLSERNLRAVSYFQENGGRFTIASGRPPHFIRRMIASFRVNAPIIALNGTIVLDQDSFAPIAERPLDFSVIDVLDDIAYAGFQADIYLWNAGEDSAVWRSGGPLSPSKLFRDHPDPWYKAVMVCPTEEETIALRDWFLSKWGDQYEGSRSWPTGFEIQAKGSDKGEAMNWIKSHLGDVRVSVGAGDFENDISLVREADIGYAVGNALTQVKAAADRITVPNTEHAIEAIIDELPALQP